MTREDQLRAALIEARLVLVTACGETAPYIKIALEHIDAALAQKKPYTPPHLTHYGNLLDDTGSSRVRSRHSDHTKGRLKTA